ncbi:M56 family metallopeptidase [Bacillus cereus group sp. BfR-BA-01538]|uniref:M56 family metallopeptidase n=1 Tax=Bacillus cereus group sp. BfR-BA-01538 TaxID=2920373 RepID=UPI0024930970
MLHILIITLYIVVPHIFNWIFGTTIMASIFILFALFIKRVLGNKLTPRGHYALWLILIVRIILPYSSQDPYSIYSLLTCTYEVSKSFFQEDTIMQEVNGGNDGNFNLEQLYEMKTRANDKGKIRASYHVAIYQLFIYIWLAGVFYLYIIHMFAKRRIHIYIKKQSEYTDKRILTILKKCKKRMLIKQNIPLFLAGGISGPKLIGIRKPKILLNEEHAQQLDNNQLKHIFYYELAHLKRKNIWINVCMHYLLILHWFNPIIWYAYYIMRKDQEIACDALALTYIGQRGKKEYGHTIIKQLEQYSDHCTMSHLKNLIGNRQTLKRRINMIKKFSIKSYRLSIVEIAVIACIATLFLV